MTEQIPAGLDADFSVERGTFRLDIEVRVPRATVTAIVGPNGAGKSTALGVLAGLVRPTRGRVALDGRVLDDRVLDARALDARAPDAGALDGRASDVHVQPRDRGIGVVFQDYLLFPHLTALENIAFGLNTRKVSKADAAVTARGLLERFGLAAVADRRPALLSGGQAQRVAVARALAIRPALLLLDEPLAALDAEVRPELRADLLRAVQGFGGSTVIVTHDPVDAMTLADEIIVLEGGAVTHRCAPSELVDSARTAFAAGLVGLNFRQNPDGSVETFSPNSVTVFADRAPSGTAEECVVVAVELAPSGLRLRLQSSTSSGFFWAAIPHGVASGQVPRTGDRVWAERRLIAG